MTLFEFVLTIAVGSVSFIIFYFVDNWKRLIWEGRGEVFCIRKTENHRWVAEKRFLCFYVNCATFLGFNYFDTKEEAIENLSTNLHDRKQNYERYIIDFSNQITDPKRLIESKKNRY